MTRSLPVCQPSTPRRGAVVLAQAVGSRTEQSQRSTRGDAQRGPRSAGKRHGRPRQHIEGRGDGRAALGHEGPATLDDLHPG